jgi:hypothetical protein
MKQSKIHKTPKDKNIYDISGFSNYNNTHNERKDAGTIPIPTFLQQETKTIINYKENLLWIKRKNYMILSMTN